MDIESIALLKFNDNLKLELNIDFNDIAQKREDYIASQNTLTYKEPDSITIKIGVPVGARIYNIPVKWEFF